MVTLQKFVALQQKFKELQGKTKSKILVGHHEIVVYPSREVLREHGGYDNWAYPVMWYFEFDDTLYYKGAEWDEGKGGFTTLESDSGKDALKIAMETLELLRKEAMKGNESVGSLINRIIGGG